MKITVTNRCGAPRIEWVATEWICADILVLYVDLEAKRAEVDIGGEYAGSDSFGYKNIQAVFCGGGSRLKSHDPNKFSSILFSPTTLSEKILFKSAKVLCCGGRYTHEIVVIRFPHPEKRNPTVIWDRKKADLTSK